MEKLAIQFENNCADTELFIPNSEITSGAYLKAGEQLHEEIMLEIYNLIHRKCYNCANQILRSYSFCTFCGFRQE